VILRFARCHSLSRFTVVGTAGCRLPPVRESLSLFMDVMAPKDESAGPIWSIDLQGR